MFYFIAGGQIQFELVFNDLCPECFGTGHTEWQKCSACNGEGVMVHSSRSGNTFFTQTEACSECRGIGEKGIKKCETCSGIGQIEIKKSITINIPPGAPDGYVERQECAGGIGKHNGPRGDLFVKYRMILPRVESLTDEQINFLRSISCANENTGS